MWNYDLSPFLLTLQFLTCSLSKWCYIIIVILKNWNFVDLRVLKQKEEWSASCELLPLSVFWKYNIVDLESRLSKHKNVAAWDRYGKTKAQNLLPVGWWGCQNYFYTGWYKHTYWSIALHMLFKLFYNLS